ncbi:hypothetical protein CNMCM7927_005075 [Aspergillus lentulus]|nr:hypothetical protein CNMCM7927_005075 [Aspergillus lentulus]
MKAKMSRLPFELLRVNLPFQFGMFSFRVIIKQRFSRERTRLQRPRDQVAYHLANTPRVFRWAFGDRAFLLLKLELRDPIMESTCIHAKMMAQLTHGGKLVRLNSPVKLLVDRVEMGGSVGTSIEIGGVIKLSAVDEPNAPLVLPGDDLALDPGYPPQSFREWLVEEDRNNVTSDRKTVYVVAPPEYDEDAYFAQAWASARVGKSQHQLVAPNSEDIVGYLAAFYHGVPVKLLRVSDFRFVPWDGQKSKTSPRFIGLAVSDECIGIRTRACPDQVYPRQLNLDDLLDVAISILPKDAYALCLLVNHDLYEDADDTFVCGRAYGGSRVAVVSSARYCPILDELRLRGEYQNAEDRQRIVILGYCAIKSRVICIVFSPKYQFITTIIIITLAFSNVSHCKP